MFLQSSITFPGPADDRYWNVLEAFHKRLPEIADAGGAGYYFFLPNDVENGTSTASLTLALFFTNKTDQAPIKIIADKFIQDAQAFAPDANYTLQNVPSFIGAIVFGLSSPPYDPTGGIVLLGSRLISRAFISLSGGPQRLGKALRAIYEGSGNKTGYTGHVVADGAVARNAGKVQSALNPAWRKAIVHITFGRDWAPDATLAEQIAIREKLTNVEIPMLKTLEPGMGTYLNEANAYEADFQTTFWGDNYKRLYRIKQHIDPKGLFITRSGVGSEDWDGDGLCRVRKPSYRREGQNDL